MRDREHDHADTGTPDDGAETVELVRTHERLDPESDLRDAGRLPPEPDDPDADDLVVSPRDAAAEAGAPGTPIPAVEAARRTAARTIRRLARRGMPVGGPDDPQVVAGTASAEAAYETLVADRASADAADDLGEHAREIPLDLTAAAFFDVDNTLVQGASIIHFARGLAKHDYFSTADILDLAWQQIKFRVSGTENSDDVASGREKALSFVAGRRVEELERLSEEIFDERMVNRIWPGTRALAQMHLDAGQQVWLVTATPVQLANVIADRLGLTGALGTVAEVEDGVFTGRLVGDLLHGVGKAQAVRTIAAREGLDLRRCTAYSDSSNDVPMLSLVGTAVAINPDAELREVARARGWEIRDFRSVRKAARIGVPTAIVAGAVGGAAAALVSERGMRAMRRLVGRD